MGLPEMVVDLSDAAYWFGITADECEDDQRSHENGTGEQVPGS